MNILCLCAYGQNRSKYLAGYLADKGCQTDYAGLDIHAINPITQSKIDWADSIVVVQSGWMKERLEEDFFLEGKRVIYLDVEDRPEIVHPEGKKLEGDEWLAFQQKAVYPALVHAIDQYLPFENE